MELPLVDIIKFDVVGVLTMPGMLKLGHQRPHITALFEELHKKGLGVYEPGKRGPGCYAKFTPNENCPKQYQLVVEAKSHRRSRAVETTNHEPDTARSGSEVKVVSEAKVSEPVSNEPKDFTGSIQSYMNHALSSLSQTFVKDSYSNKVGYECIVYTGSILVLYRVRGGGRDTIEGALKDIWDTVKSRIVSPKIKKMNKFAYTVSILKGTSFFVLCPYGCKCGADQNEDTVDEVKDDEDDNGNT